MKPGRHIAAREWYSLSQQVFEASVQFYVIFVQVTEELIGAKNLSNADQLENIQAHLTHWLLFSQIRVVVKQIQGLK